jgi:hypothetical protein
MTRERLRSGAIMGLVALVGCLVAAATYKLTAPATGAGTPVRAAAAAAVKQVRSTPAPAAFGRTFVEAMNAYAASQGDARRLSNAHCVEAARGDYMCSYALVRSNGKRECHLMQAHWLPPNPIKVTRAGRVRRCEGLRGALRSLR